MHCLYKQAFFQNFLLKPTRSPESCDREQGCQGPEQLVLQLGPGEIAPSGGWVGAVKHVLWRTGGAFLNKYSS